MPEYIEREALLEHIESLRIVINGLREGKGILAEFGIRYRNSILRAINEFPAAADVAPVVHGDWIEDGYIGYPCVCSICGTPTDKEFRTRYCPNCGARMDGNGDV